MKRGGQPGNNNAGQGRESTRALEKALAKQSGEDTSELIARFSVLVECWEKQIEKAKAEGDMVALREITDRLEGKPTQAVNHGGQEDNPVLVCGWEK